MSNSSEKKGNNVFACPHLGQEDDPCTYSSYASHRNICYRTRQRAIPLLDHQSEFCLSENYLKCPVYQLNENAVFPGEYKLKNIKPQKKISWKWLIPILVIVTSVIIFFAIPGFKDLAFFDSNQENGTLFVSSQTLATTTPIPILETIRSQGEQPTITKAPSVTPVFETKTPTTDPHTLDAPFGNLHRFVIHRIQEGESLGNLASKYNTSLQAIQDVNYFLPDPVWIDWLVIIPVDTTDVVGLPKFEAQIVVTGDETIEDYAVIQNLDPAILKFYNGYPDGYLLSSGEWLLIPHISE
jgi:LysM repeat protein